MGQHLNSFGVLGMEFGLAPDRCKCIVSMYTHHVQIRLAYGELMEACKRTTSKYVWQMGNSAEGSTMLQSSGMYLTNKCNVVRPFNTGVFCTQHLTVQKKKTVQGERHISAPKKWHHFKQGERRDNVWSTDTHRRMLVGMDAVCDMRLPAPTTCPLLCVPLLRLPTPTPSCASGPCANAAASLPVLLLRVAVAVAVAVVSAVALALALAQNETHSSGSFTRR